MILLDTNVFSALMQLADEPLVQAWLDLQDPEMLFTSTPTVFELRFGIERLPVGRRRRALASSYDFVMSNILVHRILGFDPASAAAAGKARARQQAKGITAEVPDSQIAGIAINLGASVATRDLKGFSQIGLHLINPWASP